RAGQTPSTSNAEAEYLGSVNPPERLLDSKRDEETRPPSPSGHPHSARVGGPRPTPRWAREPRDRRAPRRQPRRRKIPRLRDTFKARRYEPRGSSPVAPERASLVGRRFRGAQRRGEPPIAAWAYLGRGGIHLGARRSGAIGIRCCDTRRGG